jgi:hypothetical protein
MGSPNETITSTPTELPSSDEKITPVIQSTPDDLALGKHIDDEAGALAAQALASGPAEAEISKRVLRKIDLYILPFLCITYGLQFLNKTSLGYSSVFGIIPDNHLVGQDYSWAS